VRNIKVVFKRESGGDYVPSHRGWGDNQQRIDVDDNNSNTSYTAVVTSFYNRQQGNRRRQTLSPGTATGESLSVYALLASPLPAHYGQT